MGEQQTAERITLSVPEAAQAVGVSRRTIYNWVHMPGFPSRKIGSRRLILVEELREWLKEAGA